MRYLAQWRMQVAAHQLRTNDTSLARVADLVGYESEAAFKSLLKTVGVARVRGYGRRQPSGK
jgi:AraC-like DNA-binding protein